MQDNKEKPKRRSPLQTSYQMYQDKGLSFKRVGFSQFLKMNPITLEQSSSRALAYFKKLAPEGVKIHNRMFNARLMSLDGQQHFVIFDAKDWTSARSVYIMPKIHSLKHLRKLKQIQRGVITSNILNTED